MLLEFREGDALQMRICGPIPNPNTLFETQLSRNEITV